MTANLTGQMMGQPGEEYYVNNDTYQAATTGLITGYTTGGVSTVVSGINPNDVSGLIAGGVRWSVQRSDWLGPFVPAAAAVAAYFTSAALSNGALTIAAQPDVARPYQAIIYPGTSAITAGTLTMVYTNQCGNAVTDVFNLATAASTNLTLNASQGAATISTTACVVAGLVGGTSPTMQIGSTATIALPLPQLFANLTVYKETKDNVNETVGTITTSGNATAGTLCTFIAPTTAPNGTHTYTFGVVYNG